MSSLHSQEDVTQDAQLAIDRRERRERRQFSVKGFLYGCIKCRRRGPRRAENYLMVYTDWYETKLLVLTIALLLLSALDAAMTLTLLSHGAVEINPFMDFFIQKGVDYFIAVKLTMTAVCLVVLVAHYRFRLFQRLRVDVMLLGALFIYMGLITYEFHMFIAMGLA